ncbi:unnamed protein product [Hyaloperonospora brassicae]|uniref:HTH CENPB-type domain-containing protein n=1 Tax=Hyaloperonospora brassicae TaxID=162125 RepID=A0AAV0U4T2_HYABA|nr:unnamed protein product [Hyaloperonospora brassicae]
MNGSRDSTPAPPARPHVPRPATDAPTCPTTRAPAAPKRKRVVLSLHDKQQVLQRLEHGEQPLALAQAFGISRQQVSDIKKNRDRILSYCSEAKCLLKLKRKTLKAVPASCPGVEQELYRWLVRQQTLARAVSSDALWQKTTDLFRQYAAEPAQRSVAAMTSWLRQFKQAHGLYDVADHELQHLPEQFTPMMHNAALTSGDVSAAGKPDAMLTVDDGRGYRSPRCRRDERGNSPAQDQIPTRVVSLQTTVDTLGQLNHQLSKFEREMAMKLDYLDERVAKLCYFVLPSP